MLNDIQSTVFKNGSAILMARVVGTDGAAINQASLSAAEYSIYELDADAPDNLTPISGHDGVTLTVGSVIFNSLQTDALWTVDATGYNFRHAIDVSTNEAFPTAGARYQVRYELTPVTGQKIVVRFLLRCV